MSIKLIVTDMDGTLLNEKAEITPRTTEAILRAQDAGLEFAVATGRTLESGYSLVKEQGITCSFIELNGARLFDEKEELQFTRAIGKEQTKELIDIMDDYGLHNEFITQEGTYSDRSLEEYVESFTAVFKSINRSISEEEVTTIVKDRLQELDIKTVDDYSFLHQDSSIQVLKLLANAHEDVSVLDEIKQKVEARVPDIIVTSASTNNIEVNNVLANKGQAVKEYAASRGYKASEVITIGDNINDLTMLQWAEHSYAMSNGHAKAKEAATYLAPSHEDEAVAQIIERVLDGKSLRF